MLKPVGHIFVFSNQIMNCPMKNLWDELNWDNNRFIVTERRTTMKQIICKYLICQDIVQNPFWWDNEIKRSKTPYKQSKCRIDLLRPMYESLLTCLSVNNATDSKMCGRLVCPTIEVETYLKTKGRGMNITILADYWLETCYDVMWQCVNLVS